MSDQRHWLVPDAPLASLEEYRAAFGPCAVTKARAMDPDAVIAEIGRAGLRGRGGAGFPTGTKWKSIKNHSCPTRYVVCNAAEGEPGTFKDRLLLRRNPYATLEGILIAAHVVGAREVFFAAKASFGPELAALRRALDELDRDGTVGSVRVRIVEGPDEYLFGEEKALLEVIEGLGPLPREAHYPPYEVGLWAKPGSPNPALVNNAETLAHVSTIVRHGADSFRRLGTTDTPGTILVTLSGDVARPGVYEVEAGETLRSLIDGRGGGVRDGRAIKAVLSGVASAPLLGDKIDTAMEFGSMALAGSGLGSAGFVVVAAPTSIPRVAQSIARFLYVESCNQCSACKRGLGLASSAIDELFDRDKATPDDWERALVAARSAPQGNRCYLPVQGSLVLPALLRGFRQEFDDQLAAPDRDVPAWTIPKIVDFDEASRSFRYDEQQAFKQPDWTYRVPAERAATARPSDQPEGRVAIHLPAELAARLSSIAADVGLPLDRQVEAALRDWLEHHNLS